MELSKNFEPGTTETKWTSHWKKKKYFESHPDNRPPFTVVIPPPNVTGVLHMGHTLNETVQDILIRRARMSGFNACWVPGSDHASIATEAKVVQMLEKEKGIKKADLSREEFLRYAFEWKEKYGGIIYNQIERLGCSVDWNRVNFTMDDHYYKAVIEIFINLYEKGLIYRGARMINWDPEAKTALSDEEVEYKDITGKLYYVKYYVTDNPSSTNTDPSSEYITVATQRPETIMGDTAVCVNPNDPRYTHLKGKYVIVPLINKPVPIIYDEYVSLDFGTGALKVTPAHDINDYNLGLKFNLPVIDTLNEDGTLSEAAQVFVGMDRFKARKAAVEKLKIDGLLVKEEEYSTRMGYSQRTNAVVEPRISTQWFVKMKELAEPALKEVLEGRIRIHPGEKFLATYKYWLENVKDWCISRQLWWGQQIPAWYTPTGEFAVAATREEAFAKLTSIHGSRFTIQDLTQDPDVMDTWFSSWLWPIEVFNGITEPGNKEINYYYPTSVLVTGQDIIFFWVARMIMAGMEFKQQKPFHDVYFTGMVRDKQGRKMSKSLGNSPDLLELIDRYGADAVRFGIMISSPAGNDLLFDESTLEQGRNFNNKIWNALKLVRMWGQNTVASTETENDFAVTWFEQRLRQAEMEVSELMKDFRLSEALKTIYSLIWNDFCSWYLEWAKPAYGQPISEKTYRKTIQYFEQLLHLLHPYMPFVTEEIYHLLQDQSDDLCVKQYSQKQDFDNLVVQIGQFLKDDISQIRDARNKSGIKPSEPIPFDMNATSWRIYGKYIKDIIHILEKQCNIKIDQSISLPDNIGETIKNQIVVVSSDRKFFLVPTTTVSTENQKQELEKNLSYLIEFLALTEKKLNNQKFISNAKPEVIELEKKKKADTEDKIRTIKDTLKTMN
ncbi:MAG: valine--tRNA ligase [Chitinophagales bacterium]|nr:valine--tRNA ligase [Chitinophagales bacterium]